jgi:hypothetical protein
LAAIRSAGNVIDAAAAATDDPRKNSRRSKRFIMPPPGSYVALRHILEVIAKASLEKWMSVAAI